METNAELKATAEKDELTGGSVDAVVEELPKRPRRSARIKQEAQSLADLPAQEEATVEPKQPRRSNAPRTPKKQDAEEDVLLKPLLIQERVRDDLWRMLVATCLLNVTTGKSARPIYWKILERWPTPEAMGAAVKSELENMISILGLGDVRSSRLILFSRQYAESIFNTNRSKTETFPWSPIIHPVKSPKRSLPTNLDNLTRESIHPFAGVGQYALDSFAIYSPMLTGRGAPEDEGFWLEDGSNTEEAEVGQKSPATRKMRPDVRDRDDSGDAWRKVMPQDKELIRYLKYRWAIEGIEWDPKIGPLITRQEDSDRLGVPITKAGRSKSFAAESNGNEALAVAASGDAPKDGGEDEDGDVKMEPLDLQAAPAYVNAKVEGAGSNQQQAAAETRDWRLELPMWLRWGLDVPQTNKPVIIPEAKAEINAVASSSAADADSTDPPKKSKSALKKEAKLAAREAAKPARRLAEKEKMKAKKAAEREKLEKGLMTPEEREEFDRKTKERVEKARAKNRGGVKDKDTWKGGVIIDLGFDHLMTNNEIISMASQLGYCFSANRLSTNPAHKVLFTSFNGTLRDRMVNTLKAQHEAWNRCEFRSESVQEIAHMTEAGMNPFSGKEFVYLTADSDYELDTLRENEAYIIGGIVDKNRYPRLCLDKGNDMKVKTARLPIGKYLADMPTRKILTVNQVFEIMLQYNIQKDWKSAFETVIPQRKFRTEAKNAKDRGHKRAWEERDSSQGTSSPAIGAADDDGDIDMEGAGGGNAAGVDEEEAMNNI